MKKAISLILLLVLCFSLVACGDSTTEIPEQTDVPPSTTESNSLSAEEIAAVSGEWFSMEFGWILKVIDATTIIVPDSESGSEYTMTYVGGSESKLEFTLTDNDGNTVGTIRFDTQTDFEYPMYFHLNGRGESYCSFYGDEERYQSVLNYLGRLEADGQTAVALPAEDALRLMEKLTSLGDYKDSAEILSRFVILPQMLKETTISTVDNLGNESTSRHLWYEYDQYGRITSCYDPEFGDTYFVSYPVFRYDANGIVSEVQYGNVEAIMTPVYDDNGNIVSVIAKYNLGSYEYTFTYNDAGQRVSAFFPKHPGTETDLRIEYSYDENGRLIQNDKTWLSYITRKTVYNYDENGRLANKVITHTNLNQIVVETYTYSYDDQGRILSAQITSDPEPYASRIESYIYEDIYFYNPSN